MKSIGLRIKEARLARNMKQEELAERIGAKSPSAVSTWESGRAKPDCVTLLKICNVLEVSADQLLGYRSAAEVPNLTEWEIIKKYRYIDEFGKKAVNSVLDAEYERVLVSQPRKHLFIKFRHRSLPRCRCRYQAAAYRGYAPEYGSREQYGAGSFPPVFPSHQ